MTDLIGLTQHELEEAAKGLGMKAFVGRQLAHWLYPLRVDSLGGMTGLSRRNADLLSRHYTIGRRAPATAQRSADGTRKYAFDYGLGLKVESVLIPDRERLTLCVSSQAGCKMNCYFCATGRQGFRASLTPAQILNQILSLPADQPAGPTPLTNIVFMGMGEPLDNLDALLRVIDILTAPWGWNWSPKRITVSTVGKLHQLKELLDRTQVHVALSVHTADPREREQIMPAQKAFPLQAVVNVLRGYDFAHQRRLSLEYIMWRNVNDDLAHAERLAHLIDGLDCRVNLIPFHPVEGVELYPSPEEKMVIFRNYLNSKGILSTIRTSRGLDIDAACGMLAGKTN